MTVKRQAMITRITETRPEYDATPLFFSMTSELIAVPTVTPMVITPVCMLVTMFPVPPTSATLATSAGFIVTPSEVSQVLFRLSRWENLEYAKKI